MNYKVVALDAAQKAGDLIVSLSKQNIEFEMKNAHDILAKGDVESERIIIETIRQAFPDHGVLSEEAGESQTESDYLWIIDPIDGTINFAKNIDEYCISIALSYKDELILGVIYQPSLRKMYVAEKGKGAFLNGHKLHVSTESHLINTILATDLTSNIEDRQKTFDTLAALRDKVRHVRIFGSSALHLARIAEGQVDEYFKYGFNYWDYAAGIVLVQEAGGDISDFDGKPIHKNSSGIVATNKKLHSEVLKQLS